MMSLNYNYSYLCNIYLTILLLCKYCFIFTSISMAYLRPCQGEQGDIEFENCIILCNVYRDYKKDQLIFIKFKI